MTKTGDEADTRERLAKVAFTWAAITFMGTLLTTIGGPSLWQIINAPSRIDGIAADVKDIKAKLTDIAVQQKDINLMTQRIEGLENWREAWRAYSTNQSTARSAQIERLRSEIQILSNQVDSLSKQTGAQLPERRAPILNDPPIPNMPMPGGN